MAYMRISLLCFESDGIRVPSTSAEIRYIHGVRNLVAQVARDFAQHVQMKQCHHFIFHVDGYVGLDQSSYRVHEVTRKCGAVGGQFEICRYAGGLMAIGIFFLMVLEKKMCTSSQLGLLRCFRGKGSGILRHRERTGAGMEDFFFCRKPARWTGYSEWEIAFDKSSRDLEGLSGALSSLLKI
jgi:hypothetical protein